MQEQAYAPYMAKPHGATAIRVDLNLYEAEHDIEHGMGAQTHSEAILSLMHRSA
jgi:hypothetical protein